jgi:hypothetical protein
MRPPVRTAAPTHGHLLAVIVLPLLALAGCGDRTDLTTELDAKLARQFELYDLAQDAIVQRVAVEGGVMERDEWEALLTPAPEDRIDDADLAELRARQAGVIAESRERAIADSVVDLERVRAGGLVEDYCRELPKGGMLHIHPSGTRDAATVDAILAEVNPTVDGPTILRSANDGRLTILYPNEVAFLESLPVMRYLDFDADTRAAIRALFFLPDDPPTHPFERFEAVFSISEMLDQDPEKRGWVEEKTALDFLFRAASLGVTYVEFTDFVVPTPAGLEELRAKTADWSARTGVTIRWNQAFARTIPRNVNQQLTNQLISLVESNPHDELVGIDLLANENATPALETGQVIYVPVLAANESGRISLRRTMHSGEHGLVANPRDAILMGSERLGHGVHLYEDPIALEYARLVRHLPIEINLWSNYRLQVIETFENHPFLPFLRLGLPVSLSTDDEGMFGTDIANECRIALGHTDVTHAEMKAMSFNSLATSFAQPEVRESLEERLRVEFERFEERWREAALDRAA